MSWFSMLFTAGVELGFVFWDRSKRLTFFTNRKPGVSVNTQELARRIEQSVTEQGKRRWGGFFGRGSTEQS